jgi:hypothetical protein
MTSFFAARRQYLPAPCGLHACAKAMRFMTAANFRLKRAFRQRNLPPQPREPDRFKTCSVVDAADAVKKWRAMGLERIIVSPWPN